MKGSAPDVSIVVVAKNELPNLRRSIPLIREQSGQAALELIIIDSGSTDGTVEFVREQARADPRIRLVEIPPAAFHHARTRNQGVALARGRYVAFLGGDAVPANSAWLGELMAPFRGADQRVAATYGRQVPRPDADIVALCRIGYNYGPESRVKGIDIESSAKERYHFSTVSCCIDTELSGAPLFDESFPVDEDIAFSHRVIDRGHHIAYCAASVVEHSHDYSPVDLIRRYYDHAVLYQRLGIFGSDSGMSGDGRRYWRASMKLLRRRSPLDLARFAFAFACSAVGLQLGLHRRWLPRRARRALTVYGTAD